CCSTALVPAAPEGMAVLVPVVNMRLLFSSTAFVPRRQMPPFLSTISQFNPLTLAVGSLRGALLFRQLPSLLLCLLPLLALALIAFSAAAGLLRRATFD